MPSPGAGVCAPLHRPSGIETVLAMHSAIGSLPMFDRDGLGQATILVEYAANV